MYTELLSTYIVDKIVVLYANTQQKVVGGKLQIEKKTLILPQNEVNETGRRLYCFLRRNRVK